MSVPTFPNTLLLAPFAFGCFDNFVCWQVYMIFIVVATLCVVVNKITFNFQGPVIHFLIVIQDLIYKKFKNHYQIFIKLRVFGEFCVIVIYICMYIFVHFELIISLSSIANAMMKLLRNFISYFINQKLIWTQYLHCSMTK